MDQFYWKQQLSSTKFAWTILLCAFLLTGCGPEKPKGQGVNVGGINYIVEHASSARSARSSGDGSSSLTLGKHKFEVKGGKLTIDGKDYGEIYKGDAVWVYKDGRIAINGNLVR